VRALLPALQADGPTLILESLLGAQLRSEASRWLHSWIAS